jgi:hypothetical protein
MGVPPSWWVVVRRAVVEGDAMTGRLPLGPEEPVVVGGPLPEGGVGGGALEEP